MISQHHSHVSIKSLVRLCCWSIHLCSMDWKSFWIADSRVAQATKYYHYNCRLYIECIELSILKLMKKSQIDLFILTSVDSIGQVDWASGSIEPSLVNYSYCMPTTLNQTYNELSKCMQYGQLMRKGRWIYLLKQVWVMQLKLFGQVSSTKPSLINRPYCMQLNPILFRTLQLLGKFYTFRWLELRG